MSVGKTLDLNTLVKPESLASAISAKFQHWNMLRSGWLEEKKELRNYVFATDTRKTSNSSLPWKNSTTIPKLCQLRDNLHANYMAALFPNDEWLDWEGDTEDSVSQDKARVIKAFAYNKTRASGFKNTVSRLVLDWIDYGNCFATVDYVDERRADPANNEIRVGYVGPKLIRMSPFDIIFDPTAADFEHTPKIVRTLKSLGQLKKEINEKPDDLEAQQAFNKAMETRGALRTAVGTGEQYKDDGFTIDGFSSFQHYLASDMIEILTFYGDLYDVNEDILYEDHIIQVIDRSYILSKKPNDNLIGSDNMFHQGWRLRPDNLYAMGPLDNLIGMQYRIDHLENLKADAFDMIAFPMLKIKGDVTDFEYEPNERIYVGDEGDVGFMHPDVTALNADTQIAILEQKMEEMAGAPKQAMGIRTPGEKTAFEVQSLENAAGRIFQNKTLMFEGEFLGQILNAILEIGRRYMTSPETIKALSQDIDVAVFETITPDDIKASGKLRPIGASHFAKRAQLVQNIVQLLNSPLGMDPAINVHLSGKNLAKAAEDILDLERFSLYGENIRVMEQMDTQRLMNEGAEQLQVEQNTPAGLVPGDGASEELPVE